MALDAEVLENLIVSAMMDAHTELYPDVVVNVDVKEVPTEGGGTTLNVTEHRGPLHPEERALRAMARGIARGIVSHLNTNAEVDDTDATYGGMWRIL